jgi:hypothetical protein
MFAFFMVEGVAAAWLFLPPKGYLLAIWQQWRYKPEDVLLVPASLGVLNLAGASCGEYFLALRIIYVGISTRKGAKRYFDVTEQQNRSRSTMHTPQPPSSLPQHP